jgi:SAM-dependent methyltransferase
MDADAVYRAWAEREGEFSPRYYAYYGPNETSEFVREVVAGLATESPTILELGCSSGRHLAHLHEHGYRDLVGIEINDDAIAVMEDVYPDLAAAATVHVDAIEDVITEFPADSVDVVFSAETLQHIHRDHTWVFDEVARVTADRLVTVERESPGTDSESTTEPEAGTTVQSTSDRESVTYVNEEFPLYYRDWGSVFGGRGFEQETVADLGRLTGRAFRRVDGG